MDMIVIYRDTQETLRETHTNNLIPFVGCGGEEEVRVFNPSCGYVFEGAVIDTTFVIGCWEMYTEDQQALIAKHTKNLFLLD